MAVLAGNELRRIRIPVGNEDVVLICRQPTAQELAGFLKSRWVAGRRNKVQNRVFEARDAFMKKILVDVENVVYRARDGEIRPLNKDVENWKEILDPSWLQSAATLYEEQDADDQAEEESLGNG